jgi:hypothetical protein
MTGARPARAVAPLARDALAPLPAHPPPEGRTAVTELIIVSDLHLDGRPGSRPASDRATAFAAFLRDLARRSTAAELRLVLLGDLFDLPASGPAGGPATALRGRGRPRLVALDGIPARAEVVSGLGRCRGGGVGGRGAGNHDQALALPAAWSRLGDAIGAGRGALALHPWILYVPASCTEHGHQHHDLSVIPMLLRPDARADAPCAMLADAWHSAPPAPRVAR